MSILRFCYTRNLPRPRPWSRFVLQYREKKGRDDACLRRKNRSCAQDQLLDLAAGGLFEHGSPRCCRLSDRRAAQLGKNIAFCVVLQATIATSSLAACFVDQRNFSLCDTASAFPVHLGIKKLDRFRPKPYICLFVEICHKVLEAHQSPSI